MNKDFTTIIEKLNQIQDSSDKRFGQLDKHFEQFENRFKQFERRFDALDGRLDTLDQKVSSNTEAIESLARMTQEGFARVDSKIDKLEATTTNRINGLERRIDDLAGTRPRTEIIDNIHTRLDRIEAKVFSSE